MEEACNTRPSYNYESEKKGIYCNKHKKEGMIDVQSQKCIHENCKKCSSFNNEGETKAIYCNEHKKEGMIDIKNKKCIYNPY